MEKAASEDALNRYLPSAFLFIRPKILHEFFIYKRVHNELRYQLVGNVALAVIQRECINMRRNLA